MILKYYYDILKIKKNASETEIKKAFRKQVKKNHPDLFSEDKKTFQTLILTQIIEAYNKLSDSELKYTHGEITENSSYKTDSFILNNHAVAAHKNADYIYYKMGIKDLKKAQKSTASRVFLFMDKKLNIRLQSNTAEDKEIIKHYISSLRYLRKADSFFTKVIEKFPKSIWVNDSKNKLLKIESLYTRYQTIINNLIQKNE